MICFNNRAFSQSLFFLVGAFYHVRNRCDENVGKKRHTYSWHTGKLDTKQHWAQKKTLYKRTLGTNENLAQKYTWHKNTLHIRTLGI